MILQSLRDLAHTEGLLADPNYEIRPVMWVISVSESGEFLGLTRTSAGEGKEAKRAKKMTIPRRLGRTSAAVADFLVDKSEYALGIVPGGQARPGRRELFRDKVCKAADAVGGSALTAVAAFLNDPEQITQCSAALDTEDHASNDLLAFRVAGVLVHETAEVRKFLSSHRHAEMAGDSQCLLCGEKKNAVDKHPLLRVPGGTTSGVALVTVNNNAFESYGLTGSANAPICRDCAEAYTTALNRCLDPAYPHPSGDGSPLGKRFVRLSGDTTAVFWSEGHPLIIDLISDLFDKPQPGAVQALFHSPHRGAQAAAPGSRFYCVILTGGQGRAVLRGMHTGTVNEVEANISNYFESIDIGSPMPIPLYAILKSLVLQGKLENLPPDLAGSFFTSIIFGREFPRLLLAAVVQRNRAERRVSRERAALTRAILIRNLKREVSVALNTDNMEPGYRLGRLFAVLERLQTDAQRNLKKTIVDGFYGAASTRPATVFPRLLKLAQHHAAKLKTTSLGLAAFHHRRIGEIVDGLATIPSTLPMEQQGWFALGYYQQRQDFFKKAPDKDETENGQGEDQQ